MIILDIETFLLFHVKSRKFWAMKHPIQYKKQGNVADKNICKTVNVPLKTYPNFSIWRRFHLLHRRLCPRAKICRIFFFFFLGGGGRRVAPFIEQLLCHRYNHKFLISQILWRKTSQILRLMQSTNFPWMVQKHPFSRIFKQSCVTYFNVKWSGDESNPIVF